MPNQGLNITADDLKSIVSSAVTAAIAEARKPEPPSEKELAEQERVQQQRKATASSVVATIQNQRNYQMSCTHEHSRREGGGTHAVWVREEDPRSPGYVLCQKCQGRIRPGTYDANGHPQFRDRGAIYDTELFNRLFQDCGEAALMG